MKIDRASPGFLWEPLVVSAGILLWTPSLLREGLDNHVGEELFAGKEGEEVLEGAWRRRSRPLFGRTGGGGRGSRRG